MITIQCVYEPHTKNGRHFLIERLWPRGIRKQSLYFSLWLQDVAPSNSLRSWFQRDVSRWTEFQRRYRAELDARPESWAPIVDAADSGDVVLLYNSHDTEHNIAVVLRNYVIEKLAEHANIA